MAANASGNARFHRVGSAFRIPRLCVRRPRWEHKKDQAQENLQLKSLLQGNRILKTPPWRRAARLQKFSTTRSRKARKQKRRPILPDTPRANGCHSVMPACSGSARNNEITTLLPSIQRLLLRSFSR
jgi:hypothetical protein